MEASVKKPSIMVLIILLTSIIVTSCRSDSTSNNYLDNNYISALWSWIAGANTISQAGVYGTKGTPNAGNKPGSR
jgi:hypothetical protein